MLAFLAPTSRSQTWTWVQDSPVIFCGQLGSISQCTIGGSQIAPTKAGSVWVLQVMTPNNVTIQSITGGGGTWIKCPNCHTFNPSSFSIDAWYNLTGNAGTTQNITIRLSGVSGAFFNINFFEALPPAGTTASYDDSGSIFQNNCTTCTSVQLNGITGTDIIFHNPGGASQASWNSWSAPYIEDMNGAAYSLNTTSGTAPTVTFTGNSNPIFMAIAFKSTAGVFSPPAYQTQNTILQFKQIQQTCNPTCTFTLPQTTGSGHLLFVMAGALSFNFITNVTGGGTWVVPSGTNTCRIAYTNTGTPSSNNELSCAYALSSTAGATSINVTMNSATNTGFGIWEVSTSTGFPFVLDVQGSTVNGNSANPPGQPLTITGANDVIFQGLFAPGGISGGSFLPYTNINGGFGYIQFNNASEGVVLNSGPTATTPIWVDPQATESTAVFGVAFKTPAPIVNLADCNAATLQAALNAINSDGVTINVPAGNCAWNAKVTYSNNFSLILKGQSTIATTESQDSLANPGTFNDTTLITDGRSSVQDALLVLNAPAGKSVRLTGMSFATGTNFVVNNGEINVVGSSNQVRIDHNHFNGLAQLQLNTQAVFGVADHNLFDGGTLAARQLGTGPNGDLDWSTPTLFGSASFIFYENNTFNTQGVAANDCLTGGNFVYRFNTIIGQASTTVNNNGGLQTHPTGHTPADDRGCRKWEIYKNNVSGGTFAHSFFNVMFASAGTGLFWGNTLPAHVSHPLTLHNMRRNNGTYGQGTQPASWHYCGTSFDGTGSTWDGNTITSIGYPCLDQIGRGIGDLISGQAAAKVNTVLGGQTWPRQLLEPLYDWLNPWVNDGSSQFNSYALAQDGGITQNVDYYLWCDPASNTGCTVFNGTVGVGSGTLANRPATCTAGVGYWATDQGAWNLSGSGGQGELFKCVSTDTWSLFYVPSTYPHPLVSSTPITGPASNLYFAQVAAGTANGSSCANALAFSYVNLSTNWGTGVTQIGSGTTMHLCGIISSTFIAPTSQGTGTITLLLEPGASMQQAAAQSFIQVTSKTNSFIITGQAPCGFINRVFVPCTESIKNTANGSPANFPNSVTNISAINTSNTTGSVTIQNLEIGPLYVHNDPNDSAFSNGAILANATTSDVMLGSLTIKNSYVHDTSWAITTNPRQASATAPNGPPVLTIANVEFSSNDHDIPLGSACDPSCYSIVIHDNHSHDHQNWNTISNAYHHDGIHIFNSWDQASSTLIYNNLFDGVWNGNTTGPLFNQVAIQNLSAFNNVFICLAGSCPNDPIALWQYGGGPNQFLANNTFIQTGLPFTSGPSSPNNSGVLMTNPNTTAGASTNVSFLNNIVDSAANEVSFNSQVMAANTTTSGLDYNLYSNPIATGNRNFSWNGTSTDLFSTWQSLSGEGIHSSLVATSNLDVTGKPQTGSLAIGAGTNLTSLCVGSLVPLCKDYAGVNRPTTGAWDKGAFFVGGAPTSPIALLNPTSLSFPSQILNRPSVSQSLTLTNTGGATLNFTISLIGPNVSDFSQTNTCGTSLLAGSSCSFTVTFTPSTFGSRSATINLADNAAGSPHTVSLSGTGIGQVSGIGSLTGNGKLVVQP